MSHVVLFCIIARRTQIKSIAIESNKTIKYLIASPTYYINMSAFYCTYRKLFIFHLSLKWIAYTKRFSDVFQIWFSKLNSLIAISCNEDWHLTLPRNWNLMSVKLMSTLTWNGQKYIKNVLWNQKWFSYIIYLFLVIEMIIVRLMYFKI